MYNYVINISKKLSITQAILSIVEIISIIAMYIIASNLTISGSNIGPSAATARIFVIVSWLVAGAMLIIGIIQIVYKSIEKTSGIYLAAGIVALTIVIPFLAWATVIAALVLNIIGWMKK